MIALRKVLGALGAALLVVGAPGCAVSSEASFAKGASALMPFEFFRGTRILLPVQVNGHPVEAVLDSGAGIVTLDKAYAAKIGVVPTGTISMNGMGGASQGPIAAGVTIGVGALQLKNVTVAIVDLSSVAAGLGRPLSVILGRDAFTASVVDIDFPGHRIAFRDPGGFRPPPGAIRLPLTEAAGRLHEVPISVEGGAPTLATFDLGSSTAVWISRDYATQHQVLRGHPTAETLSGGFGGSSVHDLTTLRSIRLGGVELKNVPAILSRSANELPPKGLNVGMPVLSRFRLMIDFGHGALFLTPNAAALAEPFAKDRTGLSTRLDGDHLNVAFVTPGGPAAQGGWRVGDRIVAVDGEPIGPKFYAGPHAGWAMAPAGESVELTLSDGSKRRLVLKDYY